METEWSEDLSIGIEPIDSQHKELFRRIAALRAGLRSGQGRSALLETLDFLAEYVDVHFSSEEKYMQRYDYPNTFTHRQAHEKFIREIADYKKEMKSLDAANEITSFLGIAVERRLADWLKDHIGVMDKKLGTYLAERL
jgi:hemerythrin